MTKTFQLELGALMKRQVLYQMEAGAMRHGVTLAHTNDGGWASANFTFMVSGEKKNVEAYLKAFQDWAKRLEEQML